MMAIRTEPILFTEEQRFRQPWLWGVLVGMDAAFFTLLFAQFFGPVLPRPFGPGDLVIMILAGMLCIGITFLFVKLKMTTSVSRSGISVQFFPFHRKPVFIDFSGIREYSVRTYHPVIEYGGWGIKYGKGGLAYNVSGNKGLQMVLKDGKKVLIGTQKAEQLKSALDSAIKHLNSTTKCNTGNFEG